MPGRCQARVRGGGWLGRSSARPQPPEPRWLPIRAARPADRTVFVSAGARINDAGRQGFIPDDGRIRRVRARDDTGARARQAARVRSEGKRLGRPPIAPDLETAKLVRSAVE